MNRFLPILPSTYDAAFVNLGIDLKTQRNCSWENYSLYNLALEDVRQGLIHVAGLTDARLIDAHSFCWLLERLDAPPEDKKGSVKKGAKDAGRVLGGREKAIIDMRYSIEQTVKKSNGQIVLRAVKDKNTSMSSLELEKLLTEIMDLQNNRCALTGLPFQFRSLNADKYLLPSPDRIDSGGDYERYNIQIVCRFVNFWKGSSDND